MGSFPQGYFGAMGCLLELLKNENTDFVSLVPDDVCLTNGIHDAESDSGKFHATHSDEAMVNGGVGVVDNSMNFNAMDTGHSTHPRDQRMDSGTYHSKKPSSLDLQVTNGSSAGQAAQGNQNMDQKSL